MESELRFLPQLRMERAREELENAEFNFMGGKYRVTVNRAYYAVFYAIRAANALEHFDSSKHSGVIAFFTKTFLKNGLIGNPKEMSNMIRDARRFRERGDYEDDYTVDQETAIQQLEDAKRFVSAVSRFLESHTQL